MRAVFGPMLLVAVLATPARSACGPPSFEEHRFLTGGKLDGRIIEDVNGDGRLDLVLLEGRRLVLYVQGPGGFSRWPAQVLELDVRARMLDLGDRKDRPGKELVFVGPGGVFAHPWEKGKWRAGPELWVEGDTVLREGGGPPLLRDFFSDLDGDGLDDLLVPVQGRYVILRGAKGGDFVRHAELRVEPSARIRVPFGRQLGSFGAISRFPAPFIGDFDGDGRKDVILRKGRTLHVFLGRKDGAFPAGADLVVKTGLPEQKKNLGGRIQVGFELPLLLGDLSGNGIPDLVACLPVKGEALAFTRKGGRDLGKPTFVFRMDGWPLGAMIKDLDGKKGPDIVIGGVGKIGIWSILKVFLTKEIIVHAFFFLNRGSGRFESRPDRSWEVPVPLRFATTAKGFRMGTTLALNFDGDFNGDGRRDLVMRRGNVHLDIFLGTPEGVFATEPWTTLTIMNAEPYRYVFPETADFNGDGCSDILLHYRDWSEKRDAVLLYLSCPGKD